MEITSAQGAAWAWWPSSSSKRVRCGSPTLGRFDSCAAPSREPSPVAAKSPCDLSAQNRAIYEVFSERQFSRDLESLDDASAQVSYAKL